MTSHELAKCLLNLEDLPVIIWSGHSGVYLGDEDENIVKANEEAVFIEYNRKGWL